MRERLRAARALIPLLLLGGAAAPARADETVYADAMGAQWQDWSWAVRSLSYAGPAPPTHSGTAAISWEPDGDAGGWDALFFHRSSLAAVSSFESVRFWVHGGAAGGQQVRLYVRQAGTTRGSVALAALPTAWTQVTVTFASLGITSGSFDELWLMTDVEANQATAYLDDVELVATAGPPPPPPDGAPVTVNVAPTLDRHAISPLVYGVNFAPAARIAPVGYTVNRWGGNSTTRYNWQWATHNTAFDWFFMNVPDAVPNEGALPIVAPGVGMNSADVFIQETRAAGAVPLVTIPTIGWAPLDSRAKAWGFSEDKYGEQDVDECQASGNAGWCTEDAGNGEIGGVAITGNDEEDTSQPVGPSYATSWTAHIAARFGTAGNGGVKHYALDNEPMLWNSTHRDVHPNPVGFTELWNKTVAYASALKAQDPAIEIFGPDTWGPCDLFYTAADGCAPGDDHAARGHFVPAYLDAVCDYRDANGVLLVDWLDIHYYPQGAGVSATDGNQSAEDAEDVIARRLRSLRELWDPAWEPESWVADILDAATGDTLQLIPRLRAWRDQFCPDFRIALTEYKWGKDDTPSGALAQAEVLAIFGRERLDLATRWTAPEAGDWVEDAFRLFRNYDGAGSRAHGDSVRAASSDVDGVGSYAIRSATGRLFVLLFNKSTQSRETTVDVAGGITGDVSLWRFDDTNRLASAGTSAATAGGFVLTLPPRSATLARVRLAGNLIFEDDFEDGTDDAWPAD